MIKLKAMMDSSKFKRALARLPQPPLGEPFLAFWGSKPSDKGKVAYVFIAAVDIAARQGEELLLQRNGFCD